MHENNLTDPWAYLLLQQHWYQSAGSTVLSIFSSKLGTFVEKFRKIFHFSLKQQPKGTIKLHVYYILIWSYWTSLVLSYWFVQCRHKICEKQYRTVAKREKCYRPFVKMKEIAFHFGLTAWTIYIIFRFLHSIVIIVMALSMQK